MLQLEDLTVGSICWYDGESKLPELAAERWKEINYVILATLDLDY